ncbi:MAG: hypothetical protein MI739_07980 [Bacteroidales bacterium]|nr:hypothetical protein [Bacteroidales bacterium]
MKYILTFLLAFRVSLLFSQETEIIQQNYKIYETNIFDKEFLNTNDSIDLTKVLYDKIPENLPDWIFNYTKDPKKVIGISDPNMDRIKAFDLAIFRAKAIYTLLNHCKISNINDNYNNLQEAAINATCKSTKFQDYLLAEGQLTYNDSAITLIDTFFTKYNEAIVLIDFNTKSSLTKTDTIRIKGEYLQVFIEENSSKEKVSFFNFNINEKTVSDTLQIASEYNYKQVNNCYNIFSTYKNDWISFYKRPYRYQSETIINNQINELYAFNLSRGLWNTYLSGILTNISFVAKQLSGKVENTSDSYSSKNQSLIRTVTTDSISFDFIDFAIIDNQLYLKLESNKQ